MRTLEDRFYIAEAKILRVFMVVDMISKRPRNAKFIASACDIGLRTTYRYLHLINAIGFEVLHDKGYYSLGQKRPEFIVKLIEKTNPPA